jgi:hypothetical protein
MPHPDPSLPVELRYGGLSLQWSELPSGVHLELQGSAGLAEADAIHFAMVMASARRPARLVIETRRLGRLSAVAAGHINRGRRALERTGTSTLVLSDPQGAGTYLGAGR